MDHTTWLYNGSNDQKEHTIALFLPIVASNFRSCALHDDKRQVTVVLLLYPTWYVCRE